MRYWTLPQIAPYSLTLVLAAACSAPGGKLSFGEAASEATGDEVATQSASIACADSIQAGSEAQHFETAQHLVLPAKLSGLPSPVRSDHEVAALAVNTDFGTVTCSYGGADAEFFGCTRSGDAACTTLADDCARMGLVPGDLLVANKVQLSGKPGLQADLASGCAEAATAEAPPAEQCTGGEDEDGDSRIDCDDTDCVAHEACRTEMPAGAVTTPVTLAEAARVLEGAVQDLRVAQAALNYRRTDASPEIQVGAVIGGTLGGGYLRRVTDVVELPGGRIELRTEAAKLEDFWATGALDLSVAGDDFNEVQSVQATPGISTVLRPRLGESLDFDCGSTAPSLALTPEFNFGPSFDFAFNMADGVLNSANVRASAEISAGVRLSGTLDAGVSCSASRDLPNWKSTRTFWVPTPAGVPVPVVVVFKILPSVSLGVTATGNGGQISAFLGGSLSAYAQAGMSEGAWGTEMDAPGSGDAEFDYESPEEANEAIAEVKVTGRVSLNFGADLYGIVGPRAGISGRITGEAHANADCTWDARVVAAADLSVGFNIVGEGFGPAYFPIGEHPLLQTDGDLAQHLCVVCPSDRPIYDRELETCRSSQVCVEVHASSGCVRYRSPWESGKCLDGWEGEHNVARYSIGAWNELPSLVQQADSFFQSCGSGGCDWAKDHCFIGDSSGWIRRTPAVWQGEGTDGNPKEFAYFESETRGSPYAAYAPGTLAGYRSKYIGYGSGTHYNYCGAGGGQPIISTLSQTYWCSVGPS